MEVFSLEDDDYGDMFITQSAGVSDNNSQKSVIIGGPMDFMSPCSSLVSDDNVATNQYSDISDAEDFDIPSSQVTQNARR